MNHLVAEANRLKKMGCNVKYIADVMMTDKFQCSIKLSMPPSINNYYTPTKKGFVMKPQGRAYKKLMSLMRVTKIEGSVSVMVKVHAKNKVRRDLDNLLKPILDGLTACELYADDSQVDEINIKRCEIMSEHIVYVYIDKI
jgi:Holliday junction resolvase RusA-like endonuclease